MYRRHRREEILIRPTVLDNAYRNSSSRVESFQRSQAAAPLLSLFSSLFPARSISLRFAFPFPLAPLLFFPPPPSCWSGLRPPRRRPLSIGSFYRATKARCSPPLYPHPFYRGPAGKIRHRASSSTDEPFPSLPPPLPSPLPRHLGSPLFRGDLSFLLRSVLFLLLPPCPFSSAIPNRLLFDLFRTLLLRGSPALFLFRCRERVQGRDSAKELARFSIFSVRRPTGLKDGTEVGGPLDGRRAEISTPSWEMEFIAATECTLHASLSLSLLFFYFFLFRSFDGPRFSFLVPLSLSVTWQIEIDAVHDTMERVSPRVDRSIRIRWVKRIFEGQ